MSPNTHTDPPARETSKFHTARDFFPTLRQGELFQALNRAPNPGLALLGYGGAMGGGKTRAIVELAIDAALAYPGNNILVARHNFTDLSATTMREFFIACPPELIRRRQQSPTNLVELALPDWPAHQSSTVNFRHLTDWTGLGSQQYGAVLIDEAGEVDEEAALMLLTRLRLPAQQQRWFVAASNPWPGWFERWFVHRELPEQALHEAQGQVTFIPAKVDDNPHLPDDYANLQRALLPGDWVDRFIEGRFDAFMGRVYPYFDQELHQWQGPLPNFTRYIGGLDFGGQSNESHYTAGIVAGLTTSIPSPGPRAGTRSAPHSHSLSPFPVPAYAREPAPFPDAPRPDAGPRPPHIDRRNQSLSPQTWPDDPRLRKAPKALTLIRLAEFEDRGPGVTQRLEQWQRQCRKRFGPIRWAADRSQFAWIDHQRRQGIKVVPANGGPDSVNWGISLVQDRLSTDPPTSYYSPELKIFPTRMSNYQWLRSQTNPARPRKKDDDLLDADRYMHELATQIKPRWPKPMSLVVHPVGRPGRWSGL